MDVVPSKTCIDILLNGALKYAARMAYLSEKLAFLIKF